MVKWFACLGNVVKPLGTDMQDARIKRAAEQRMAAGHAEYTKHAWLKTVNKAELLALAEAAMADGFMVTTCRPGRAKNIRLDGKILAGKTAAPLAVKKAEPWVAAWSI